MIAMTSQITCIPIVSSTVCSGADQRKHQSSAWLAFVRGIHQSQVCSTVCSGADQIKRQSSAWLAFVRGIHRWAVWSPHKGPITQKIFVFDDVIMIKVNIDSDDSGSQRATSDYENQCLVFLKGVLWYSFGITLTRSSHEINPYHAFLDYTLKIITAYPRGHWFTVDQIWNHKRSSISQHGNLTVAATWVVIYSGELTV